MSKRVLILGASGKIGRHSSKAFADSGWQVKHFDRKQDDMVAAAQGCEVIVNGLNPQNYHNWEGEIPKITAQVIAAAQASNATVMIPGNVYHFGDKGGVWSEQTKPNPISRKGVIRLKMERDYAQSGVQTIVLRAGNFIDPNRQECPMSAVYLRSIKSGKITLPGPADVRQAMCYVPDWARACVALAEKRSTLAQFEDVPFPGYTLTANDIKSELESITKRDFKFVNFPWWAMTLAGPVWELARELNEMRYLWNTDHALSEERFQTLLPDFEPTPFREALAAVLGDQMK